MRSKKRRDAASHSTCNDGESMARPSTKRARNLRRLLRRRALSPLQEGRHTQGGRQLRSLREATRPALGGTVMAAPNLAVLGWGILFAILLVAFVGFVLFLAIMG